MFAALINLMAASLRAAKKNTEYVGFFAISSSLIVLSTLLLVVAFWLEPAVYSIDRPFTFWAIVAVFAGVIFQTLVGLFEFRGNV